MYGLIKEYLDDYLKFWALLGAALLKPIEELSFRARKDGGWRNSVLFLGFAMLTNAVLIALMVGQSLGDIRRFVIFVATAGALSLLGYLSFAISWKLFRYNGDIRKLMRLGFYFNGIYVMIGAVTTALFHGAFKVVEPALYKTYHTALLDCSDGILAKGERLTEIASSDPIINILNTTMGGIVFFGILFYWIASVRAYFRMFPMGRLRGTFAFLFALTLTWILTPLGWVFMVGIGQAANNC